MNGLNSKSLYTVLLMELNGKKQLMEQNKTEYLFCLSIYSLSQLQSYKMHGLLNIHIQSNNYSLDGIQFTILLE